MKPGVVPSRLHCEKKAWVDRGCQHVSCPLRLHDGKLCERIVIEMFQAGDNGASWGMQRSQANVAWALGVDQKTVSNDERTALVKLRRRLEAA